MSGTEREQRRSTQHARATAADRRRESARKTAGRVDKRQERERGTLATDVQGERAGGELPRNQKKILKENFQK